MKPPYLKPVEAYRVINTVDAGPVRGSVSTNCTKKAVVRLWEPLESWSFMDTIDIVGDNQRAKIVEKVMMQEIPATLTPEERQEIKNAVTAVLKQFAEKVQQDRERVSSPPPANRAILQNGDGSGRNLNDLQFAEPSANSLQTDPPALALCPNILRQVVRTARHLGVAGVANLVALTYLVFTSRLLTVYRPVSLAIKGPSSGGKSWPVEQVVKLFPDEAVLVFTAVTDKALIYDSRPLAHRTLVLLEAQSLSSDFLSYMVRSLLSEGCVKYLTTEKNEDGEFQSREIERPGPTGLLVTTTAAAIEAQTETRILSVTVNDTPQQTKRIMRAIAAGPAPAVDLVPWHELQRWLATGETRVVIPFAKALAETIEPVAVRLRRDFTTLLALIATHALLHRAGRQLDADQQIIAEIAKDYGPVRRLIADAMGEGVAASISPTLRETVQAVEEFTRREGAGTGMNFSQLAKDLKIETSSAQRRAEVAIEKGYIINHQDRPRRPAQLVRSTDPLPEGGDLLPTVETVREEFARLQRFAEATANSKAVRDRKLGDQFAGLHGDPRDGEGHQRAGALKGA